MQIEDPQTGNKLKITSEFMAKVIAVCTAIQFHVNCKTEEAYSIIISKTPTAAGDCFLYLKNLSDEDLLVYSICTYAASDESVQIKLGDTGTSSGGSANTPVNRNAGSGNAADCTCEDGVNITGLSGGSVVEDIFIDGVTSMKKYRWKTGLVLKKNDVLTLYAVTGGIALKVNLGIGFYTCE